VLLPDKVSNCLWGLPGHNSSGSHHHIREAASPPAAGDEQHSKPSAAPPDSPPESPELQAAACHPPSSSGRCCGQVRVRYKLLPKGTYVRFQPELRAFHEVVGADPEVLRDVLESCLLGYCTLSEGDWVQVRRAHQQSAHHG
jgi:hypothetical protein